ncbi:hypothetical protein G6321_00011530 [Bradyrhizobium barranii subsp. barranii]|uniref:Uncharacterized protein n=1 Tax=Bradyrhizobium barranii subsp. barranii TaxID=2823807 RepID=A0A7Z0Q6F5_9BRAD|nr:hypothetical protein [Bradyrhizobium barranii]UGX95724.1 hypothetical protein G6321_00011530 [Bradyrhizobium barranii subsp. barranii]
MMIRDNLVEISGAEFPGGIDARIEPSWTNSGLRLARPPGNAAYACFDRRCNARHLIRCRRILARFS